VEVGHWLVRMEWRSFGRSLCLPLLIFPCTIKYRSSRLAPAHPGGPGKSAVKRLWCGGGGCNLEYIRNSAFIFFLFFKPLDVKVLSAKNRR